MERQPWRLAAHPSQTGMQYPGPYGTPATQYAQHWHVAAPPGILATPPAHFAQPSHLAARSEQFVQVWHPAQFAQPSHRAAPSEQFAQLRRLPETVQTGGFFGSHPTAQPGQKRELVEEYCLIDEDGNRKPFSSVSQISGKNYEGMISNIFRSGGPRTLCAVDRQQEEERQRLQTCKKAVADFLRETVSDHVADGMRARGVGEEQAEVDTVYHGSFKEFAENVNDLSAVKVRATCAQVQWVLVEICSDSRFVAMKLYQIEIQSCLVERQGYLARDDASKLESVALHTQTTGFAIVFNRAALYVDTKRLAERLHLRNVSGLLENGKLHIVYFQAEAALPAALERATEALQLVRGMRALCGVSSNVHVKQCYLSSLKVLRHPYSATQAELLLFCCFLAKPVGVDCP